MPKRLDLMVEIPQRFKKGIRARFDLRRGENKSCPLCKEYWDSNWNRSCTGGIFMGRGCPFKKYETHLQTGCIVWLEMLGYNRKIFNVSCIEFTIIHDIPAFKKFKRKMFSHIKWVKEEK